ncbi:MAG: SH3 domain-containing protein [Clostridiales bacterium]|nr:SH3 domain-containing protein [Clostridiales bacterium]
MKKILSVILTLVMAVGTLALPINSYAATSSSKAGVVSISSGKLNVRKSNSTSSAIITTLNKGGYVTLISKNGSWWHVEYSKGQYGYVHADYIKTVSGTPSTVKIQSGTLNVRTGAGISYTKVASLQKGETVITLSNSGGWSRILYHGTKTGYVNSQYLMSASQNTGSGYSKLSLSIPSYQQTDSRWANYKIGNSDKTIAQIGCATTAIAMIESYRNNTTIYPDAMSRKLSYSSSGDLYWPSDYKVTTSSSGYLQAFYNTLKEGKPVLFGAKTSTGRQHWVVVTGYTGGDTLTAANFTINDPGSNSRVNLQQFINAYPVFYKYFVYK